MGGEVGLLSFKDFLHKLAYQLIHNNGIRPRLRRRQRDVEEEEEVPVNVSTVLVVHTCMFFYFFNFCFILFSFCRIIAFYPSGTCLPMLAWMQECVLSGDVSWEIVIYNLHIIV